MEYIGKVLDEDIFGNGILRLNNIVVFIKYASLNDEIKYKIIKKEKNYYIGELLEDKKEYICPYYKICGGCSLLHTKNEKHIKENYIRQVLKDYNVKEIINNNDLNYRNKITLHIKDGKLGFFNENSNELVEIESCLLADPNINKIIKELKKLNLKEVTSIIVRASITTKETLVKFVGKVDPKDIYSKVDSIYINDKLVHGKEYITEIINGITYTIYPDSFFQVNTNMMIKLYDKIKEYAGKGNKLLDLYCGTGTIGIYLKDNFKEILGIELNKESIKNANINKRINDIKNINFKCMDCKDINEDYYDTVIVDPPRSGLNKNTIKFLNNMKSEKIIYVSCNPITLRRDLKLLTNYKVKEITPVNMFNKTSHCESVCILERR